MADLEQDLRTLATALATPEPPDLRAAVRARIDGGATKPSIAWKRWMVAIVAVLVAGGLVASPQARAALADMLRFAGVEVHWGSDDSTAPPTAPLPGQLPTSLADARDAAAFSIGVPTRLGPPDRVLVSDSARVVSLLYGAGPATIRLDEFDGRLDPAFNKTVAQQARPVNIGTDTPGLWLRGPHTVRYIDRSGVVRDETARLAGNTLIWELDGVTYRLEGDLTREQSMAIADSVR